MSRLWPDQVRLLLLADSLEAQCQRWGGKAIRQSSLAVSAESTPWPLRISQCLQALPHRWFRQVQILLADQHVQFMMLPGVDVRMRQRERLEYARALMVQTWGEQAVHWPFRLQNLPSSRHSLLVTAPLMTGADLRSVLTLPPGTTLSIQPYATALMQQARLPATGSVLVPENQVVRLFQMEQGHCRHVASHAATLSDITAMSAWLLRERLLMSASQQPCFWLQESGRTGLHERLDRLQAQLGKTIHIEKLPVSPLLTWP